MTNYQADGTHTFEICKGLTEIIIEPSEFGGWNLSLKSPTHGVDLMVPFRSVVDAGKGAMLMIELLQQPTIPFDARSANAIKGIIAAQVLRWSARD